jgi:predicted nicotinamide N-methyase
MSLLPAAQDDDAAVTPAATPAAWQLDKSFSERFLEDFVYVSDPVLLPHLRFQLRLEQATADVPETLGRSVWDGAVVLARFLEAHHDTFLTPAASRRIIEIGAGCGLAGMVAARITQRPADVVLSDLPEVLDQLRFNCAANQLAACPVLSLDWNLPLSVDIQALAPFDLILGADILYMHVHPPQLLATLDLLLAPSSSATVLLACEQHDDFSFPRFCDAVRASSRWLLDVLPPARLPLSKPSINFMQLRRPLSPS